MRTVFADTVYWVACANRNDPWHRVVKRAKSTLAHVRLLTTDEVLNEFLALLSRGGEPVRCQAVKMVRAVLDSANVEVVPQTRDSFLRGLDLYECRPDKQYSLTDCISMNAMRAASLTEVLTNDRHFEQEGFTVLLAQDPAART